MPTLRRVEAYQIALKVFDDWADEAAGHYCDPVVVPSTDWKDEKDSHENVWRDLVERIAKVIEERS